MIHGIGVDLVEVERFAAALARRPSIRQRLFTATELDRCDDRPERLAARFAAKEAVAKALGTGIRGFAFVDIEVLNGDLGKPSATLLGPAADVAASLGVTTIHVSMSHTDLMVAAYAVAER